MLIVAATLMFNENSFTACDAFPSNSTSSVSMSFPSDLGDFLVVRLTSLRPNLATALIPSRPTIAPDGRCILALCCLASDSSSG